MICHGNGVMLIERRDRVVNIDVFDPIVGTGSIVIEREFYDR